MPEVSGLGPRPAVRSEVLRGAAYMVASAAAFAVTFTLVRHVTRSVHPFEAAFFRNLFGLIVMLPWLWRVGLHSLETRRIGFHLLRAASGLSAMLCLFTAISLMPLAEVTALTFTAPIFATAGAALLLGETVRIRRWTAVVIGFIGTLIILRPGAAAIAPGALAALAASLFMASAMLCIKSLSRTENPEPIVFYFGLLVTPLSLIPALFVWTTPDAATWLWLALLGAAATLGQILLVRAFASAEASAVLPFDFSKLVFVSLIGVALFDEVPAVWTWVGASIVVAASVYIAHREARAAPRAPAESRGGLAEG